MEASNKGWTRSLPLSIPAMPVAGRGAWKHHGAAYLSAVVFADSTSTASSLHMDRLPTSFMGP